MGVYVVVALFAGFCGVVDVWAQPREGFAGVGSHKSIWFLIQLAGFLLLLGPFTLLLYNFKVRRRIVTYLGYDAGKAAAKRLKSAAPAPSGQSSSTFASAAGQADPPTSGPVSCSSCSGTGSTPWGTCRYCNGTGQAGF